MTMDQRDQLMDLHRAAMRAQFGFDMGEVSARALEAADDAFRAFLFRLDVTA